MICVEKTCTQCGTTKPIDQFYFKNGRYAASCRICSSIQAKRWRQENPEKFKDSNHRSKEKRRKLYAEDESFRQQVKLRGMEYWRNMSDDKKAVYSEKKRYYHIQKKYGLTKDEYEKMLLDQGSVCACCGLSSEQSDKFDVDHCHKTGSVRGILCGKCNKAIGLLGDNLAGVQKAVDYLAQHEVLPCVSSGLLSFGY